MHNTNSKDLFDKAKNVIVGGVNSPSRSFTKVGLTHPIFMDRARGAYFWDVDGNRYIDYLAAFGPIILGHAHPSISEAIIQASSTGILYGAPTQNEFIFANMLRDRIPSMEIMRFVNSGTEAVMTTIRLARAYTKRDKILKFSGCYHGHFDLVLIAAGSGPSTLGIPDSAGIPEGVAKDIITVPYNDLKALERVMKLYGDQIAGILVEPLVGNFGIVPPTSGFLELISKLGNEFGSLVIYDEVITAFRFHYGAVQTLYNIEPDLTALGKIIGGGLPIGAYGGKQQIMNEIAPEGPVYQAGTMAGNPLSITAGIACIQSLSSPGVYEKMDTLCKKLCDGIRDSAQKYKIDIVINRQGGAFAIYFTKDPVINYETAKQSDEAIFAKFFRLLLLEGIYIAPSKYEAWFISTAHTNEDINFTLKAIDKAFKQMN